MQKTLVIILTFLNCSILCGQSIDCKKIVDKSGVSYLKGSNIPFTGHCIQYNNGKLEYEGSYLNGIASGLHKWYYKNGRIKEEVTYVVNGDIPLSNGVGKIWFENGKLKQIINYKNGHWEGEWVEYNKDGKLIKKGLYKDNILIQGDSIKPLLK